MTEQMKVYLSEWLMGEEEIKKKTEGICGGREGKGVEEGYMIISSGCLFLR